MTSIIVVDRHFAGASALFNPNAFPAAVRGDALACGDRLAILTHSVDIVLNELRLNRARLLEEVRSNRAFDDSVPQSDRPALLVFHNLNFVSGLYSALIAFKSLLDLYSRLIAKMLVPSASVFGFGKGSYKGRKMPGGKFLNWIEGSSPESFPNREALISVLLDHIGRWAGRAVEYRDGVVHGGSIPGMSETTISLDKTLSQLREADVVLPMMPNGIEVADYSTGLVQATRTLITESLVLLPGVDVKLLSFDA